MRRNQQHNILKNTIFNYQHKNQNLQKQKSIHPQQQKKTLFEHVSIQKNLIFKAKS